MLRLPLLAALVGTFVMGGLVGYGVSNSRTQAEAPRSDLGVFGSRGPLGQTGAGLLPALPPGLSLDSNGVIQGLDLRVEPGTKPLTWETLKGIEYASAAGLAGVPAALEAVDGQRVTMIGFLMPLYEFDHMRQFLLVGSHWSCCFGIPPGMNGAANVTLDPKHAGMPNTMEPLRVVGTFRVKEVREEGWLVSIFSLEDAQASLLE